MCAVGPALTSVALTYAALTLAALTLAALTLAALTSAALTLAALGVRRLDWSGAGGALYGRGSRASWLRLWVLPPPKRTRLHTT